MAIYKVIVLFLSMISFQVYADIFEKYSQGDFKQVKSELLDNDFSTFDSQGVESLIRISIDTFSQNPEFELKQLQNIFEKMSKLSLNSYVKSYLTELLLVIEDSKLLEKSQDLVFLDPFIQNMSKQLPTGFNVDHKFHALIDILSLYCHRSYLVSKDSSFLFFKGWLYNLKGRGNDYLLEYLKLPDSQAYSKRAKVLTSSK